jgi:hypothetical protein
LAETGRPDGHRPGQSRDIPATAAGRCVVGRRAGDRRKAPLAGIERLVGLRAADPQVLRDSRQPVGLVGGWPTASTTGRSSRIVS